MVDSDWLSAGYSVSGSALLLIGQYLGLQDAIAKILLYFVIIYDVKHQTNGNLQCNSIMESNLTSLSLN